MTDVSVVICTRNRAASLSRTLAHLEQQELSGLNMEVIVVDNGSIDGTAELLRLPRDSLRLIPLYEGVASKSRALNLALGRLTGELVLFTDDDVSFGHDWVSDFVHATHKFNGCALFCGPIIPIYPPGTPQWLQTHQWSAPFFGKFSAECPEGPLPLEFAPYGANVAVRAKAIAGMQFRVDLGPSQNDDRLMGEDVEFSRRVRDKWNDCVYVPSAPVNHHIRPEQVTPSWLCDRAFGCGRSVMLIKRDATIVSDFKPNDLALDNAGRHLDQTYLIHYYSGQLAACSPANTLAISCLRQALCALDVSRYEEVLIPEANTALFFNTPPSTTAQAG